MNLWINKPKRRPAITLIPALCMAVMAVAIPIAAGDNDVPGAIGDSGPARNARLSQPNDVALGADGSIYIADTMNHRVRKVDVNGVITTVAGNGEGDYAGDGGPARRASLALPTGVAVAADGSIYIVESYQIRKVNPAGVITTVAGSLDPDDLGDGGPALDASFNGPGDIALAEDGSIYVSDHGDHRIRKIDPAGIITTVAGNGRPGYSGDGGRAQNASLNGPRGVVLGPDGSLYIADTGNNRIRKVAKDGTITTVAGSDGTGGPIGDGGVATKARLGSPRGVAVAKDGSLYIADFTHDLIRKVDPKGVITTVAGGGTPDDRIGDGGPATAAELTMPAAVAVGPDGSLYIADTMTSRVRKVSPDGTISTLAGSQTWKHHLF